jgi:hypothetical protein
MGFMGSRYRAWEVVNGVAMRMSPSVVSIEQFGAVSG